MDKEIKTVIADLIGDGRTIEKIKLKQSLIEDLDFDSVRLLVLAGIMEDKFNVIVEDRELENIKTVGDVIKLVQERK